MGSKSHHSRFKDKQASSVAASGIRGTGIDIDPLGETIRALHLKRIEPAAAWSPE